MTTIEITNNLSNRNSFMIFVMKVWNVIFTEIVLERI